MKAKQILFSGPMVQAIIAGRKTQTRRVVKGMALDWLNDGFTKEYVAIKENGLSRYQVGDILYVRETWQHTKILNIHPLDENYGYVYRAEGDDWKDNEYWTWKPSIFMPREAARIFLEVTDVRIERLNDISEQDAIAEGVGRIPIEITPSPSNDWGGDLDYGYVDYQNIGEFAGYMGDAGAFYQAKESFVSLWQSINGRESWETNPFVWVYTFKQVEIQ